MDYQPSPWMILPFALLLAALALLPLWCPKWWLRHYPKVALTFAAITLTYYLFFLPSAARGEVVHTGIDYLGFIALIGSLYVVSGGIHITVKGEATPVVNTVFLGIGAVLANIFGTTGASMLMIRPWLRMNRYRVTGFHVVFFIFIVSNVGGCLTPIGDPPLFLGYLRGVPFWWVGQHCWPMWLVSIGFLLAVFYGLDLRNYLRAPARVRDELAVPADKWRFEGLHNLFFLGIILLAVFVRNPPFLREGLMVAAALGSWFTTRRAIHEANHFDFHPIKEVAILFIGIFATMMPALHLLKDHAPALMGSQPSPTLFYWGAGSLSSILDNAPTYLSFLSSLLGIAGSQIPAEARFPVVNGGPEMGYVLVQFSQHLVAISVASVFFGACTYIGNGPNFMVKSIADHQKVRVPDFLAFIFKWSVPVMLPMLALVWLIFFRG